VVPDGTGNGQGPDACCPKGGCGGPETAYRPVDPLKDRRTPTPEAAMKIRSRPLRTSIATFAVGAFALIGCAEPDDPGFDDPTFEDSVDNELHDDDI
jgi:hypothetical protein